MIDPINLFSLFLKNASLDITTITAAKCVNIPHLEKNALKGVLVRKTCATSSLDAQIASIFIII